MGLQSRSLLELRRLAYRAKRSAADREVLHDALLETFPVEYNDVIRRMEIWTKREAQRMARLHRGTSHLVGVPHFIERHVIFHPSRLKYVTPRGSRLFPKWTARSRLFPKWTARNPATILFSVQDGWQPLEHKDDIDTCVVETPIRYR